MSGLAKRLPNRRRARRVIGWFPSTKSRDSLPFESRLERDALLILEMDPAVKVMQTQPLELKYWDGPVLRRYIPDIQVWGEKDLVIEVKPAQIAATAEFQRIVRVRASYFAEKGLAYEVWTEREIRLQPRFGAIRMLWRYLDHEISEDVRARVREAIQNDTKLTLGSVIDALGGDLAAWRNAYALVAQRVIRTVPEFELRRHTRIVENREGSAW